jgi:hypothetical protein
MKNHIIFTLLIGILILSGCGTAKLVTQAPQTPSQKIEAEEPVVWKQAYYPKVALGDPIVFLNSKEVVMDGNFSNESFFLQDGVIYKTDSIKNIKKTIPKITPGKLISFKKGINNQIEIMVVSFSQNDASYQLSFYLKKDGSFTLSAKAKLLFEGKEYPINVITVGGECVLLVNFKIKIETTNINEQAEGQNVSGTKVIKN